MDKEYIEQEGWFLTKEIQTEFLKDEEFAIQILEAMAKFLKNDWGITCKEDWQYNDKAAKNGDAIVSKYETKLGNIFIISEKGHKMTTILFTHEY